MTDEEFRSFLEKRTRLSKAQIEVLIQSSSGSYHLDQAKVRGEHMSEETATALTALKRKTLVANLATYDAGVFSKDDVKNFRIDKLPDDFPL